MKRAHVLAVTFLAGLIVGCAVPAHAEIYQCKDVLLTGLNGAPEMAGDSQYSIETHQGFSELAYRNSTSKPWMIIGSADMNKPESGGGKVIHFTRNDGLKITTHEAGSGLVIDSVMFRAICTGNN